MQSELIVAIVTGLITLLASFVIATVQARAELRKMAKQLEERYTTSLFEKRLDAYPELFKILNSLTNAIEYGDVNRSELAQLQLEFDNWMSQHALFLTNSTARVAWGYHDYLIDTLEESRDQPVPDERWKEIQKIHKTLGKFLRAELGVFSTDAAGNVDLKKTHIAELLELLSQSSSKVRVGLNLERVGTSSDDNSSRGNNVLR